MAESASERVKKLVSGLSYSELEELIELATHEREGKLDEARKSLMAEFHEKAASIGLTPAQLFGQDRSIPEKGKRGKRSDPPSGVVKFRSPNGQTWSGRGRKPNWLTSAEADGHHADEFRVHDAG